MPEISRFFGIAVTMNYNEHRPPHFHIKYGGYFATMSIRTLSLDDGTLPPRVRGMVIEWAAAHQQELLENWERCEQHAPLMAIAPLE